MRKLIVIVMRAALIGFAIGLVMLFSAHALISGWGATIYLWVMS